MKPKQTPVAHPKAAQTGLGVKKQTPGNAGKSPGPSNHVPVHGNSAEAYSSQQQQQK
jgi:hypothetical protein